MRKLVCQQMSSTLGIRPIAILTEYNLISNRKGFRIKTLGKRRCTTIGMNSYRTEIVSEPGLEKTASSFV
jgi:hypothetical protein